MARPIRVLIAEDHEDTRDGYTAYLRQAGMEVRAFADGLSALAAVRGWTPDVAVLDLSMPKMTGDEVARALRKELGDGVAIVILSGFAEFGRKSALAAGADEYRSKPCLPHELAAIVEGLADTEPLPEPDEPGEETA